MSKLIETDEGRVIKRRWKGPVMALLAVVLIGGGVAVATVLSMNQAKNPGTTGTASTQLDEKALEGDGRSTDVKIAAQTASNQAASGDTTGAAQTLKTAAEGATNVDEKVSMYLQLAALYANTGDKQNAVASEEAAIKLQPNNWKLYKNQGSLYTQLGDSVAARASYSKALDLIKGTQDETAYSTELKGLASGAIE